jgi:hypothetical protein
VLQVKKQIKEHPDLRRLYRAIEDETHYEGLDDVAYSYRHCGVCEWLAM